MADESSSPERFALTTRTRVFVFGCVLLLALPTVVAGGFHGSIPMSDADDAGVDPSLAEHPNLTVVTAQGGEVGDGADSRVVVFDPDTGEPVWQHDEYETYYDVDPIDNSTLLYVGMLEDERTYAVEHDWRRGEHERLFEIPFDSHDVDALGDGEYAYLDGRNDTAVVYNATREEEVWTYDFREHYPPQAGNGPPTDYSGDYTHLNDVVAVDDGSAFLLSPRNFDRVMLVDRETKEVEWTLGEEDNYEILNQQHNPSLISQDPPTVLVSDSENDRVVEYRRADGEWELVWEYRGDLVWPRDADRLPNGNTLIVDSHRAIEVTPDREIVWEEEIPRNLYDIERVRLGDEPGGPSVVEDSAAVDSPRDDPNLTVGGPLGTVEEAYLGVYNTAYWVIPWWLGPVQFAVLLPALVLLFAWGNLELDRAIARHSTGVRQRVRDAVARFTSGPSAPTSAASRPFVPGLALLVAGVLVVPLGVLSRLYVETGPETGRILWDWVPPHVSVALLLSMEGAWRLLSATDRRSNLLARLHAAVAATTVATGVVFAASGLLSLTGLLGLSNAGVLATFGIIAVFGVLSLGDSPLEPQRGLQSRIPRLLERVVSAPPVRYVAGLAVAGAGVFVLGQGLQTPTFPLLYLTLAFVLLVDGDRIAFHATEVGEWGSRTRGVLTVLRYAVRPVWLVVAGALVAKLFGAGAMANVVAEVHFLNPVTIAVGLFLASRLVGPLPRHGETDVAVSPD